MCDTVHEPIGTWQGWIDVPEPEISTATGGWIDLTHVFSESMPKVPHVSSPSFPMTYRLPDDYSNVTEIHMSVHTGTHLDSPFHFINDGPGMDEVPLDRMYGPGVVWHLPEIEAYRMIEPEDLMACTPELRPGDILLLDTGWWDKCGGTPEYEQFPCLSQAAAEWLVEKHCKLVGIDNGTPEMAMDKRPEGWKWPVHHTLLSHGVLVGEFVRNMKVLAGQRVEVMFLALNLAGADGAPARVIARPIT
jgi:kynurenine formamidase